MQFKSTFLAVIFAAALAGCAGEEVKKLSPVAVKKPEWIRTGSGVYAGDTVAVFYGVGVANAMPNITMQRKMADQRAREEVAASMKTSMKSMVKDYMDHHVDYFNADTAGSDEFATFVSKSVVDAELINCRVVDHWEDTDTGAFYALARMDSSTDLYNQYKENLRKAISENHAKIVGARAADAIKELDAAVDGQRKRENELLGANQPAPVVVAPAADAVPVTTPAAEVAPASK